MNDLSGMAGPRAGVLKKRDSSIFKRDPLDWYVEPSRCTEQLIGVERFSGRIHDPCCGGGNIVDALLSAGFEATGSDVKRRVPPLTPWFVGEIDFLKEYDEKPENIIFNPPFFKAKGAEACIRKALACARVKVAAFVDVKFLSGKGRAEGLYAEFPPSRIWHITPRPSCPPGEYLAAGNKAGGGTPDYCWIVWSRLEPSSPLASTGWLRRSAK